MNEPIKLSNTLTAHRQGRTGGWVLTEAYTGKNKKGEPTSLTHEYFYGTLQSCVRKACDIEAGKCKSLEEIKELLAQFTKTTIQLTL